ncbi:hypothetical protein HKCCE2091_20645 [Rhodobacterales bacterium HKCCE2091]|nr:hypothetical protein [Rhodobacterales bacterium HKCCE2091]
MIRNFWTDESGAISVDYVVLACGAVAMSMAASDVVRDGLRNLSSDLEAQLRTQQISDAFVNFQSSFFDPLYDAGAISEEQASDFFSLANEMTNAQVLTFLENGIERLNDGDQMTEEELGQLFAVASVAYQRNIVDDEVIEYYFVEGGNPNYVSTY